MKLLLCSEGFATPEIIQACADLCGKPNDQISVAIINEAYAVEPGDKRWVIEGMRRVADNFGEVDIIGLLALSAETIASRIAGKDLIFVIGGNTDYLMSVFQKSGFASLLPQLLQNKVYVGSSAGSMVLGKRISEAAYKLIYGEESIYGITEYLGLVDFSLMPHLDSPDFPNRRETLLTAVGAFQGKVYGIRDDTAVVINGDEMSVIGSGPVEIN